MSADALVPGGGTGTSSRGAAGKTIVALGEGWPGAVALGDALGDALGGILVCAVLWVLVPRRSAASVSTSILRAPTRIV